MSQMDSDGVEDVVNGQGRLLAGAAGTAMAAAARLIAERTRRQREAAAAQLVSDQARAEADRRLLLVRLVMAKTDQWREQAPLEQVAETLYLARLHERTEPSAAAAIPELENHVRTRFDCDPDELVNERIRLVSDQREAETVYALDAVERAASVTGAGSAPERDATIGREHGRGQGRGLEARAAQGVSAVSGAASTTGAATATAGLAATPPTPTPTPTSAPASAPPLAPTAGPAGAVAVAGPATQGGTRAPSADAARRARVRPPAARSRTATTNPTSAAASWRRSSAQPAQPAQGSAQSAASATPLGGPVEGYAPASSGGAPEPQVASGEDLAQQMLAQHRAAHARSHTSDQALEYGQ